MNQRAEPHDSLDDFPTPPWATRALLEQISPSREMWAWEPACNRGHMCEPLRQHFRAVDASDVYPYGYGRVADFLMPGSEPRGHPVEWVITNPPFRLAEQFALRGFEVADAGVALFVRLAFLEGVGRRERLFKPHPPAAIYQFTERVVLHKGKLTATGSTATAYCWVVWRAPYTDLLDTKFCWIDPCRKRLERPEDYTETHRADP